MDWQSLTRWTKARVGLHRAGGAITTEHSLALAKAQALARDALWQTWDKTSLTQYLEGLGVKVHHVSSQVTDRRQYLARPDLGRRLSEESRRQLEQYGRQDTKPRIAFCISDGLSAEALHQHMEKFIATWYKLYLQEPLASSHSLDFVLVPFARVAAADDIGEALRADVAVICVGERPGLSSHDSLGIYLTFAPKRGRSDAERNCISNVREPEGLNYLAASAQLCYLLRESLLKRLSGVHLKVEVEQPGLEASSQTSQLE